MVREEGKRKKKLPWMFRNFEKLLGVQEECWMDKAKPCKGLQRNHHKIAKEPSPKVIVH